MAGGEYRPGLYQYKTSKFDYMLGELLEDNVALLGDLREEAHRIEHFIDDDPGTGGELATLHPNHEPPGEGGATIDELRYAGGLAMNAA